MTNLDEIRSKLEERERLLAESEENNRALRIELEKDKAAFARVSSLLNTSLELPLPDSWSSPTKLGLGKAVEEAIRICIKRSPTFTSTDVAKILGQPPLYQRLGFELKRNKANVSAQMRRLTEKKLIIMLTQGSGRRPSTYRADFSFASQQTS